MTRNRQQKPGRSWRYVRLALSLLVAGSALPLAPAAQPAAVYADGGPTNQDAVFTADIKTKGGTAIRINSSGISGNQVWFAPAGTTSFVAGQTMTRAASGIATTIAAPAKSGSYKLYVLDSARRASLPSAATLIVDSDPPTNQNAVFGAAKTVRSGTPVPIASSGDSTNAVWFAQAGTTKFVQGATMTTAGGMATEIAAPANAGTYRLYVVDEVGNVSAPSTAVLTVKNTAPTNQNSVFATSVKKKAGADVAIASSGIATNSVWFAPAGTTSFIEGATMTKAANGIARTIKAPDTDGAYKLYVVDEAGNVSAPSAATLTVDGAPPMSQDTVFPASVTKKSGASVTIISSGDATNQIWFAPPNTTVFTMGSKMTKAASGTATSILAPADTGFYKLYVLDSAGNRSAESAATLTVDNTVATVQNAVFPANAVSRGGLPVAIVSSGNAANEIWFAPANTTVFSPGATMTRAGDGTATTINAPFTAGTYKLYVKTAAGFTPASTATLTVDNTPPTNQNAVFGSSVSKRGGDAVKIASSGDAGGVVWFAPAGTTAFAEGATMTRAGGTATSIAAPAAEGAYRLFVFDAAGNQSAASTAILTVDNTPPTNQNAVFPSNITQKGGAAVSINASVNVSDQLWFAPAGTTSFAAGSTMTKAASGTATSLVAPSTAGPYKMYVVDAAGNVSAPSNATLTVNNSVPNSQDTVFGASLRVRSGAWVAISSSGDSGNEVWFAPSGTRTFAESATMTRAGGTDTGIYAPTATGSYKLYIRDSLGRFSSPSIATLTVSNTAPSNQNSVFTASVTKQGGASVTINSSGDASNEVWFAPSGATAFDESDTMTRADSGIATTIAAPVQEGAYKLYVRDAAGNTSAESTAVLTVRNTGPTVQNSVFPQSVWRKGGTSVTIVSSGNPNYQIWFAPEGTTTFSADSTMARAASGTATSMLAPTAEGEYKLFAIDELGNVSAESLASLFVDNTAPTLGSAEIDGAKLTLAYDEALNAAAVPPANSYVVAVNGVARAIKAVAVSDTNVVLTLLSPVASDQTVTVGYSRGEPKVQDAASNAADNFTGQDVSNMTGEGGSPSGSDGGTTSGGSGGQLSAGSDGAQLNVTPTVANANGKETAKATVDAATLTQAFEAWKGKTGIAHRVRIDMGDSSASAKVELAADAIASARKTAADAAVAVKFGGVAYELPIQAVDPEALAKSLGVAVKNMRLSILIDKLSGEQADRIVARAGEAGVTPLSDAVEFKVLAEATGKTALEVKQFGGAYIARTFELGEEPDAAKTTGALVNPDTGELSFVPTLFRTSDGVYRATMKRPGNSAYVVVKADKTFADIDAHWAKDDIEMLASKLIVKGKTDDAFGADEPITRAQFTSLLVRALGLSDNPDGASFADVAAGAWYAGAVGAAVKAGLVSGYENGTFGPNDNITREQMAVMIAGALKAAGKPVAVGDRKDELLGVFLDAPRISAWAADAVAQSVEAGIINGMTDITFEPAVSATRAQAVVMLRKLLQYAEFIN